MRRSAAPSYRAAKRGRFIPPILPGGTGRSQENAQSQNDGCDMNTCSDKPLLKQLFNPDNSKPQDSSSNNSNTVVSSGDISKEVASDSQTVNGEQQQIPRIKKTKSSFNAPCFVKKQEKSPVTATDNQEVNSWYFSVVWCKLSKKKHKKWDGDGILVIKGRTALLKDLEGKEIGRGSGYKVSELETLKEGQTLAIGGKEVEIMGAVSSQDYMSGKCFHNMSTTSSSSNDCSTFNRPSSHTKVLKPFNKPGKPSNLLTATSSQSIIKDRPAPLMYRHSPDAPGALVMPRPSNTHQWENNHSSTHIVDVVIDPHICQHLRPHQREGVTFLYECVLGYRTLNGHGAILGDEMGLGKTLQCITLVWTLHKQNPYGSQPLCRRTLIITPGSLVKNWCVEFRKWLGNERMKVYPVTAEKRVKEFSISPIYPVMVISYEMFIRSMDDINDIKFDLVICDEAHRLKNSYIKTNTLIAGLKTRRRILLTGTPIQNDLKEFHSLIELCNPGVLGSQVLFRRIYEQPIIQGQQPNASSEEKLLGQTRASELNRLTSLFFLRRTSEINNQYLPSKVETVVFCRPSQLQLSLYRHLLTSRIVRSCLVASNSGGTQHLVCISVLKKICNHPSLVYEACGDNIQSGDPAEEKSLYDGLLSMFPSNYDQGSLNLEMSGKLATLSRMLEDIYNLKERVVVVSNYTQTLDVIQRLCESCEYKYLRLDGATPTARRQPLVERFNSKHSSDFVFLLSSKAGGVGLNLIGASKLILYDIDWNPANDLQAMARVWRDGQKKKVYIYRLLTTGTIEEKIYQRQTTKQSLSGAVADAKKESKVEFTIEDIRDLFKLHENTHCATHDLLQCRCALPEPTLTDQHNIETRSCQLGVSNTSTKKQTSISELMDWQHVQYPLDDMSSELDESLRSANSLITFIFRSENNNSCQISDINS